MIVRDGTASGISAWKVGDQHQPLRSLRDVLLHLYATCFSVDLEIVLGLGPVLALKMCLTALIVRSFVSDFTEMCCFRKKEKERRQFSRKQRYSKAAK